MDTRPVWPGTVHPLGDRTGKALTLPGLVRLAGRGRSPWWGGGLG